MKKMLLYSLIAATSASMSVKADRLDARELTGLPLMEEAMLAADPVAVQGEAVVNFQNAQPAFRSTAPAVLKAENEAFTVKYLYPNPFFWGVSSGLQAYSSSVGLYPAYTPLTWINKSTGATSYKWFYPDPTRQASSLLESTETDLVVTYSYLQLDPVRLEAYGVDTVATTSPLAFFQTGGSASYAQTAFGVTTTDIGRGSSYTLASEYNTVSTSWNIEGTILTVDGFANIFPKPAHSYTLTRVWTWFVATAAADARFKARVYRVDEDGAIGDIIATGETTLTNGVQGGNAMVTVNLRPVDEDGFETDEALTIDSAIMIEFYDLTSENGITECAVVWRTGVDSYESHERLALVRLLGADGNPEYYYSTYFTYGGGTLNCTSYMMMIDATFTWLVPEKEEIVAPVAGSEETVMINSYYYSVAWSLGAIAQDWITAEIGETTDRAGYVKITVAPNTTGTEREGVVTVTCPGSVLKIPVKQGAATSLVNTTLGDINVAVVQGDFVVTAPAGIHTVSLYTVTGQFVKTVTIAEGINTIAASELTNSVYFLRFNNNAVVKVVK